MPERRRAHLTPFWRLFARRWLATVVSSLAIATVVCGLGGFTWQYAASTTLQNETYPNDAPKQPRRRDWSIPVFKTMQLFLLNSGAEDDSGHPSNWLLIIARLSAAALFLVVSSAVIIRVVDEVRGLPSKLTRREHIVICGLGQIGLQLLEDLVGQGRERRVIVIENNPANPWLEYARGQGATIVVGDSTKELSHLEARTLHASQVFVVNGDDGVNLEVVAELENQLERKEAARSQNRLRVYVHIADTNFATTLRPYCKVLHDSPNMSVQVFNVPRTAAVRLVTHQLWPHAPKGEHEVAHFVILGFGAMGQALAAC